MIDAAATATQEVPRRSKLDPYRATLTRLLAVEGYSLDRCCTWMLEHHGVSATRELLRVWSSRRGIFRKTIHCRLDALLPAVTPWFAKGAVPMTAGQACKRLRDEHGLTVAVPTLEAWLNRRALVPFRLPRYQDDLDRLQSRLLDAIVANKMSPREACTWLWDKHGLSVPATALKQWLVRRGSVPANLLTRKRVSCLDPFRQQLSRMFRAPDVSLKEGTAWLITQGGPAVSAQALGNWLQARGLRPPPTPRTVKWLGRALDEHREALVERLSKGDLSIKASIAWISSAYGLTVSAQTLSAWMRRQGLRAKGRHDPK